MFGNARHGSVALGTISNIRIENGVPVCDVEVEPFMAFSSVQFLSWGGLSCLPKESITVDPTTRAVLVFPENPNRHVRVSPIVVGVLGWPTVGTEDAGALQEPRGYSPDGEVSLVVADDAVSIRKGSSDKEPVEAGRGREILAKLNEVMGLLNSYHDAIQEVSTAAAAPSATLTALQARRAALGGAWPEAGQECLSDALKVQ